MAGIADFEVCLPESRLSVEELHKASGLPHEQIRRVTHVEQFPVLGEHDEAWRLAARAGRAVLDRAGVPPDDISLVIYAGSGEWDHGYWSPAARVAHELGVTRAHCFELSNFCNAGMAAVQVAADRIDLGRSRHALVLLGDRLSRMVDRADPNARGMFNFGDAGAAVLLAADDHGYAFELLHSEMRTDPSWADYYHAEHVDGRALIRRGPHRDGLSEAFSANFGRLIDRTLAALGRTLDDVAYVLVNHGDRNTHQRVLSAVGVPADKSVFNYDRLGHMAGADSLIALNRLREERRLRPGDLILMATSGVGFSWGVTALACRGPAPAPTDRRLLPA